MQAGGAATHHRASFHFVFSLSVASSLSLVRQTSDYTTSTCITRHIVTDYPQIHPRIHTSAWRSSALKLLCRCCCCGGGGGGGGNGCCCCCCCWEDERDSGFIRWDGLRPLPERARGRSLARVLARSAVLLRSTPRSLVRSDSSCGPGCSLPGFFCDLVFSCKQKQYSTSMY